MDQEDQFEQTGADASCTKPKQASACRKNEFMVIKKKPCKIVEMSTSKTGKHGHAKIHFTGLDVFTGKKYEDICPSTHNVSVPDFKRHEWEICDLLKDKYFSMMDEKCNIHEELKHEPECDQAYDEIQKIWEEIEGDDTHFAQATILECMGQIIVKRVEKKKRQDNK